MWVFTSAALTLSNAAALTLSNVALWVQAQLKSGREEVLRKACPALTDELVAAMKRAPMRGFDSSILKEPHIYRWALSLLSRHHLKTCWPLST